jgi:hypothetical protein
MLEYYARWRAELLQKQRESLIEIIVPEEPRATVDETSCCHLTLVNIRTIPAPLRVALFQKVLLQSKDEKFKKDRLPGALAGCFWNLPYTEMEQMTKDVRAAVRGHENEEMLVQQLDTYYA